MKACSLEAITELAAAGANRRFVHRLVDMNPRPPIRAPAKRLADGTRHMKAVSGRGLEFGRRGLRADAALAVIDLIEGMRPNR